jgi:hypothetical protein
MTIERIGKRIGQRDWGTLINIWLEFLPQIEFPIEVDPPPTSDIEGLGSAQKTIAQDQSTTKDHYFVIPGLHQFVFPEAVYLFYKSLNVLKSAQCDILNGFKTWSIANAYEASYFGLKCFLNIVGVHSTRLNNKDMLIDFYPSYSSLTRKQIDARRRTFEINIQLIKQLEHWEYWTLFQRVINTTKNLPVEKSLIDHMISINPKMFAKKRNLIIYFNNRWIFNDLKNLVIDPDFFNKKIFDADEIECPTEDDAFTILNAFLLLRLNHSIFKSIAESNPNFRQEFDIINFCIQDDHNDLFNKFWGYDETPLRF